MSKYEMVALAIASLTLLAAIATIVLTFYQCKKCKLSCYIIVCNEGCQPKGKGPPSTKEVLFEDVDDKQDHIDQI